MKTFSHHQTEEGWKVPAHSWRYWINSRSGSHDPFYSILKALVQTSDGWDKRTVSTTMASRGETRTRDKRCAMRCWASCRCDDRIVRDLWFISLVEILDSVRNNYKTYPTLTSKNRRPCQTTRREKCCISQERAAAHDSLGWQPVIKDPTDVDLHARRWWHYTSIKQRKATTR